MNKKIRWITETAVMLALLVALQAITKPLGQIVTGSFVNVVLAITVLVAGLYSGITVALISPICAFLLGFAPTPIVVLPIMVGNACYVVLLALIIGKTMKPVWKQPVAVATAATVKFGVMYLLIVLACKVFSGVMWNGAPFAPPAIIATFEWRQLVAALIGGSVALLIVPVLRKALHK